MPTHVAFLRGINVGKANRLPMADLRTLAEREGLAKPRTLLQTGNLLFEVADKSEADLELELESAIAGRFGLTLDVVVRTADALRAVLAANPFRAAARDDPAHLVAVFLKSDPAEQAEARLKAAITGPEVARVIGREAFIHYSAGIGDSRLTPAVVDRALGARGTARNWNTILKIAALAEL